MVGAKITASSLTTILNLIADRFTLEGTLLILFRFTSSRTDWRFAGVVSVLGLALGVNI